MLQFVSHCILPFEVGFAFRRDSSKAVTDEGRIPYKTEFVRGYDEAVAVGFRQSHASEDVLLRMTEVALAGIAAEKEHDNDLPRS
jgi:hypothetical protein